MGNTFESIINESRASIEKDDLKVLLPLVAEIEPQYILEIGMHQGYSMELWRKAFNPVRLIGLEINPHTPESYVEEAGMMWNTDSHIWTDEFKKANKILIDFLFIDGDHSYEGVKQDFEMYSPLVKKGGIVAFHDALYHHDGTEEVDIFWNEIKNNYPHVEIKMGKNSTGIGVIWI